MKIFFSLLFFCFLNTLNAQGLTKETLKDSLAVLPSFTIHKDNYFITGIPTHTSINKQTADAKYQISFKQLIFRKKVPQDSYLYIKYTQKAFWNIYEFSSPFEEINFNPGVAYSKYFYDKSGKVNSLGTLALEHESNGRDSIYSRSWNFVSLDFNLAINDKLIAGVKGWIPFSYKEGNPDLMDYSGYGQLNFDYEFIPNKLYAQLMIQKGLSWDWKGAARPRILYNPFNSVNQFLVLEWFTGYDENLIEYDQYRSVIRVGFLLKSNELDFLRSNK
ncbi:phospholipase A [Zunongwangia endophytica]|uniref:Phosphatidylcholine 1-acylhydrolase n=1 Tax=Zunongwangia endophytica TaxID=1808945 RepID=A0ABV8H2R0_9FLAO|nr:phospholipase A [Zunongwangia endophytica]MDN3596080.1 phospholipase A [Zunongwangia endophytica]